jgi:hypothetical protein
MQYSAYFRAFRRVAGSRVLARFACACDPGATSRRLAWLA